MIDCITWETAHLFGDAWISHHRLRYRMFVERQHWEVPSHNQLEYDQFDTPAAVYLLWRGAQGKVCGTARLISTERPYMLKEIWPELVSGGHLPESPRIWEATRIGVDRDLSPAHRRQVARELIAGCLEYGLDNNIGRYVFVMPLSIIKILLTRNGCTTALLGEPTRIENHLVAAAEVVITRQQLERVRETCGLHGSVMNAPVEQIRKVA